MPRVWTGTSVRRAPGALWVVGVCLLCITAGCRQTQVYQASALPQRYAAKPIRNAQSLNLSRLGDAAGSIEIIQPGDVLAVTVATGLEEREPTTWMRRVSNDGSLSVPLIGGVPVGGMTLTDAERQIAAAAVEREIYRTPNVAVAFQTRQSNRVTVVGAVGDPGVKELPLAASQLVDAVVAAGGLTKDASNIVEVRYPPQFPLAGVAEEMAEAGVVPAGYETTSDSGQSIRIDLERLEASGGGSPPLPDGAVLTVVRRQPPTINVVGLVNSPGQYEIPPDTDLRLLGALALGGGRTTELADKVTVVRHLSGAAKPIVIETSVRDAKHDALANLRLGPGDVVSVDETPVTFSLGLIRDFVGIGLTSPIPGL